MQIKNISIKASLKNKGYERLQEFLLKRKDLTKANMLQLKLSNKYLNESTDDTRLLYKKQRTYNDFLL